MWHHKRKNNKNKIIKEREMKTRKIGVYAVAAAFLLVAALLVTNCLDPINTNFIGNNHVSGGFRQLSININEDSSARTIFPDLFGTGGTTTYQITILDNDGNDLTPPINNQAVTNNANITLPQATYRVRIEQLINGTVVAGFTDNSVVVGATGGIVTATMLPLIAAGTGTFRYNLTAPGNLGAATATMEITELTVHTTNGTIAPIVLTNTGWADTTTGITLNTGYYNVKVTITPAVGSIKEVVIEERLHVYQDLISTWTYAFATLVPIEYTIQFSAAGATGGAVPANITGVVHGNRIERPTEEPELTNFTFDDWYTTDTSGGVQWVFGTAAPATRVIGNMTLFARWTSASAQDLTVTLTPFTLSDLSPTVFISTLTHNNIMSGNASERRLIFQVGTSYTNVQWFYGDTELTNALDGITIGGTLNRMLTIDFGGDDITDLYMNAAGTHDIGVTALLDGVTYSALIRIIITGYTP